MISPLERMRAFSGGVSRTRDSQKVHVYPKSVIGPESGAEVGSGRLPRPGTVHTTVPVNGLRCLRVPSAIRVRMSAI